MKDWSQSFEQAHIEEFADRFGRQGRFLDIGAFDGATGSNSRWLALNGWAGVMVEPSALAFHQLAEMYAERNDILCVNALVDAQPGLRTFWYAPGDLLSTTEQAQVDTWATRARFLQTVACAVTLEQLLAFVGGCFDLVSLDTEGTAVQLLRTLTRHRVWPDVQMVVVEFIDGEEEHEIAGLCGPHWHVLERTSNNVIMARQ